MHKNGCVADFFLLLHLDTLLYIYVNLKIQED